MATRSNKTILKPDNVIEFIKSAKETADKDGLDGLLQKLEELREAAEAVSRSQSAQTLRPSSVKAVSIACQMTGVTFEEGLPEHTWKLTDEVLDAELRFGTKWAEAALADLVGSSLLPIDVCEALVRTSVGIVLYDRLKLLQELEDKGVTELKLEGEFGVSTHTGRSGVTYSGFVDYAIGHGDAEIESALVAIEQRRMEAKKKIVTTVYGIAVDGKQYQFFRLDETKCLQASRRLLYKDPTDYHQIFKFVDNILQSTIRASPHTTPNGPNVMFPSTVARRTRKVEEPRFVIKEDEQALAKEWSMEVSDDEDYYSIVVEDTPSKSVRLQKHTSS